MSKRNYTHIKELLPTIKAMAAEGMSQREIAEHFGFTGDYACVCGATMDEARIRKADVIRYALNTLEITEEEKHQVLMVGDREHDVLGAKENGLSCMGVLYGYGDRKELEEAGADYIAKTTAEVAEIILNA